MSILTDISERFFGLAREEVEPHLRSIIDDIKTAQSREATNKEAYLRRFANLDGVVKDADNPETGEAFRQVYKALDQAVTQAEDPVRMRAFGQQRVTPGEFDYNQVLSHADQLISQHSTSQPSLPLELAQEIEKFRVRQSTAREGRALGALPAEPTVQEEWTPGVGLHPLDVKYKMGVPIKSVFGYLSSATPAAEETRLALEHQVELDTRHLMMNKELDKILDHEEVSALKKLFGPKGALTQVASTETPLRMEGAQLTRAHAKNAAVGTNNLTRLLLEAGVPIEPIRKAGNPDSRNYRSNLVASVYEWLGEAGSGGALPRAFKAYDSFRASRKLQMAIKILPPEGEAKSVIPPIFGLYDTIHGILKEKHPKLTLLDTLEGRAPDAELDALRPPGLTTPQIPVMNLERRELEDLHTAPLDMTGKTPLLNKGEVVQIKRQGALSTALPAAVFDQHFVVIDEVGALKPGRMTKGGRFKQVAVLAPIDPTSGSLRLEGKLYIPLEGKELPLIRQAELKSIPGSFRTRPEGPAPLPWAQQAQNYSTELRQALMRSQASAIRDVAGDSIFVIREAGEGGRVLDVTGSADSAVSAAQQGHLIMTWPIGKPAAWEPKELTPAAVSLVGRLKAATQMVMTQNLRDLTTAARSTFSGDPLMRAWGEETLARALVDTRENVRRLFSTAKFGPTGEGAVDFLAKSTGKEARRLSRAVMAKKGTFELGEGALATMAETGAPLEELMFPGKSQADLLNTIRTRAALGAETPQLTRLAFELAARDVATSLGPNIRGMIRGAFRDFSDSVQKTAPFNSVMDEWMKSAQAVGAKGSRSFDPVTYAATRRQFIDQTFEEGPAEFLTSFYEHHLQRYKRKGWQNLRLETREAPDDIIPEVYVVGQPPRVGTTLRVKVNLGERDIGTFMEVEKFADLWDQTMKDIVKKPASPGVCGPEDVT